MYPATCPLCGARDERLGRDFEHVSMRIQATGTVVYLRCRRCLRVFEWPYDAEKPPTEPVERD